MRFKIGDLVRMRPKVAKNHINQGGYGAYLSKVGIVIDIPKAQRSYETIIVKFPCDEPPEEWLESDFEPIEGKNGKTKEK
jgi:hypothetical protein